MTVEDLLPRLEAVRSHSIGKWTARCKAHQDTSPSLSIREGERGILLHCWAGCTLESIVQALNLSVKDLFYDAPDTRTAYQDRIRHTRERQLKAQHDEVDGLAVDALREAEYFLRLRQGLDISAWSPERLHDELNALGDAYALLECEALYG